MEKDLNKIIKNRDESKQDNDEFAGSRNDDGSRMAGDSAAEVESDRDRSDIRVFEEGLGATYESYSFDSPRNRRRAESERLVNTAKQAGLFIPRQEYARFGCKIAKRTGESIVYVDPENGRITKIKDPYAKGPLKEDVQPEDAILEHLVHNKYFPEIRYTFVGIGEDIGDVRIILAQDYVEGVERPTKHQIEEVLAEKGLLPEGSYRYGNEEIYVTDVIGDNAIIGADGKVYFIDPIINFKKPIREILRAPEQHH